MASHRVFLSFFAFGLLSGVVLASNLEDEGTLLLFPILLIWFFQTPVWYLFVAIISDVETVTFSYAGPTGPNHWGSLTPKYATCSTGKQQSPIDILQKDLSVYKDFKPLERDYKPGNSTLLNSGYNVGVRIYIHI